MPIETHYRYYYWAAVQADLLPLDKVHLHIAQASFGPVATVAAMLLLFCLVTGHTQKAFNFLSVRSQFVNVTFRYHIMNSGFSDSKIFNTNILVKRAIAYVINWCFIL